MTEDRNETSLSWGNGFLSDVCHGLITFYNQDQDASNFNEIPAAVMTSVAFVLRVTASMSQICTFIH